MQALRHSSACILYTKLKAAPGTCWAGSAGPRPWRQDRSAAWSRGSWTPPMQPCLAAPGPPCQPSWPAAQAIDMLSAAAVACGTATCRSASLNPLSAAGCPVSGRLGCLVSHHCLQHGSSDSRSTALVPASQLAGCCHHCLQHKGPAGSLCSPGPSQQGEPMYVCMT